MAQGTAGEHAFGSPTHAKQHAHACVASGRHQRGSHITIGDNANARRQPGGFRQSSCRWRVSSIEDDRGQVLHVFSLGFGNGL